MLSNAPFVLNLDCNHYVNNSKAIREAMCFLLDIQVGKSICFVQFPQKFDSLDKHDRYANRNTVLFNVIVTIPALQLSCSLHPCQHEWKFISDPFCFFFFADKHEMPRWNSGTCLCWYRMYLQKESFKRL